MGDQWDSSKPLFMMPKALEDFAMHHHLIPLTHYPVHMTSTASVAHWADDNWRFATLLTVSYQSSVYAYHHQFSRKLWYLTLLSIAQPYDNAHDKSAPNFASLKLAPVAFIARVECFSPYLPFWLLWERSIGPLKTNCHSFPVLLSCTRLCSETGTDVNLTGWWNIG